MKNLKLLPRITTLFALLAMISCSGSGKSGKTEFISIGTGGVTGVYYPTGGAVAKMINAKEKEYGIRASAESTAGSIFNVNTVLSGDLEFGIVQSDVQYFAKEGLGEWKDQGPQEKLRAICSFHAEAVTLVAATESGINSIKDLKGKTVNLGPPGSGQRKNSIDVLTTAGLNPESDIQSEALKSSEAPKMLQDSRLDAFFFTVGHPSGTITEATSGARAVRFIPIPGMDALLAKSPFYSKTKIPSGAYPKVQNKSDVDSIGVKATFVTSSDVSNEVVYAVTKEIFDNLDEFKKQHPAFASLTKENMLEALSAPLHDGALQYYKEVGLR